METNRFARIIALILCAAMMLTVLAGCQQKQDETPEEPEEQTNDFDTIYDHVEPSTPVMKIGDIEINWGMFYYYFYQEACDLYGDFGTVFDWTAEYENGMSYLAYCANEAVYDYISKYAAAQHFANEYNVTLTEAQIKTIEEDKAADLELFESVEEMNEYMKSMYLDQETVDRIAEIDYLYLNDMDAVVGVNGEKADENTIMTMAETAYKMIKFVEIPKSSADAKANAEAALAEVKAAGTAGMEAKFDELIAKYTDSEKVEELTNGYVYTRGNLGIPEVENNIKDVEKNAFYDGIIESDDNYYIVMRKDINLDAYPYYGMNGFGENPLREMYKDEVFDEIFWNWADSAEVEFYDILVNMDINEVLGWNN